MEGHGNGRLKLALFRLALHKHEPRLVVGSSRKWGRVLCRSSSVTSVSVVGSVLKLNVEPHPKLLWVPVV